MGVKEFIVGVGGTAISGLLSVETWKLKNIETGEVVEGQFPAEEPTREVSSVWGEINTLNRQNSILQFIRGENDKFTLPTRFVKRDILDGSPIAKLEKIISWARIDEARRRPPRLRLVVGAGFNDSDPLDSLGIDNVRVVGNGAGYQADVILNNVAGITYSKPNKVGGIREVKFQMNFTKYVSFDLETVRAVDTRYARAIDGDFYERLAKIEYGDAMLGVVVRKLAAHDRQLVLNTGDIVKLPSIEGVRNKPIRADSVALKTAFGRKDTPQRELFQETLAARNIIRPTFI